MSSLLQNLRHTARRLVRSPGFTLVAVATLALGIGAVTAIFSVLYTLLLVPLPYRDAGRVAFVLGWDVKQNRMRFPIDSADYAAWRDTVDAFASTAVYRPWSVNLSGEGSAERLQGYRIEPGTFELLGVEPALGRTFDGDEARREERVVVLSDGLWRRRFNADPSVVGRTLLLNREPWTVVGVMPEGFEFPQFNFKGDLWGPLDLAASGLASREGSTSVVAVARLAPGVRVAQAQAQIDAVYRRLVDEHPAGDENRGARVIPIQELLAQQIRPALVALMAAVALLLLIACANVAHLLLARALDRRREMAVRAALGAARGRLVAQMLVESLFLGLAGGAVGLLVAVWMLDALKRSMPDFILQVMPAVAAVGLDPTVLAVSVGLSLLTGLLFGLAPALRLTRVAPAPTLRSSGTGATGRQRTSAVLVAAEVALSMLLLVGAGLLSRSFWNLSAVDPGFDPEGVAVMETSLPTEPYPDAAARRAFYDRLQQRVEALPGVTAAGWVNHLPLSTSNSTVSFRVDGGPAPDPAKLPRADLRIASPGYFEALGIPRLAGRTFLTADAPGAPQVAVVNRRFADTYLDGDAVGRSLRLGSGEETFQVVGVVGDIHHWELSAPPEPEVYVPLAQSPPSTLSLAIRTAGDPRDVLPSVRAAVAELDPDQPVFHLSTMEAFVARSLHLAVLSALLMGSFAAAALLLSAVGLAGVLSYAVGRRRREIGIRMALGARSGQVVRLVLRQGMTAVTVGALVGLAAAIPVTRLLGHLLFGVDAHDPWTFVGVALLLAAVALAAAWLPARRATRVDPREALAQE